VVCFAAILLSWLLQSAGVCRQQEEVSPSEKSKALVKEEQGRVCDGFAFLGKKPHILWWHPSSQEFLRCLFAAIYLGCALDWLKARYCYVIYDSDFKEPSGASCYVYVTNG
jgi:hypothetical protein